jgi:hypothetical protein
MRDPPVLGDDPLDQQLPTVMVEPGVSVSHLRTSER